MTIKPSYWRQSWTRDPSILLSESTQIIMPNVSVIGSPPPPRELFTHLQAADYAYDANETYDNVGRHRFPPLHLLIDSLVSGFRSQAWGSSCRHHRSRHRRCTRDFRGFTAASEHEFNPPPLLALHCSFASSQDRYQDNYWPPQTRFSGQRASDHL